MKRISIIIPVYNGASYIRRCIGSILEQDHEEYEIILVDDGSEDNTLEIAQELAAGKKNFFVIHQKNQGVGAARNAGIEKAQGEWLYFLDADDELMPGALEHLSVSQDDGVQWVICSLVKCIEGTEEIISQDIFCNSRTNFRGKDGFPDLLNSGLFMYPCGKLYRKQIIKEQGLIFPERVPYGEDIRFNLKYFQYVDQYVVSPVPAFIYHIRQGEGAGSTYYQDSFQMQMDIQREIMDMVQGSYYLSAESIQKLNRYFVCQGINTAAAYLTVWRELSFRQRLSEIRKIMSDQRFQSFVEEEKKIGGLHTLDYLLLKNKHFLSYYGMHYLYTRWKKIQQRRKKR